MTNHSPPRLALALGQTDREVNGFVKNLRSSFYGKVIYDQSIVSVRRGISSIRGGSSIVASVVGRGVQKRETVIPDPDYRIPVVLLGCIGDVMDWGLVMMNRFKRKVLRIIADFLSNEEVEDIKVMFKKMDTDNDGVVSMEELKAGL